MCHPLAGARPSSIPVGVMALLGQKHSLWTAGGLPGGRGTATPSLLGGLLEAAAARKRRVFFSFHFQNDINRVNVVRQSWRYRPTDNTQPAEWFDHSLWEATKKSGASELKKLINGGMKDTSAMCVLAGSDTWDRPWVRYEVAYALARGKGLFGAYIHNIKCVTAGLCKQGNNPFDHMGVKWGDDNKAYIWEKFSGKWRKYAQIVEPVSWPKWLPNVTDRKFIMPLSRGVRMYDYVSDDGYTNFTSWANTAAAQAGH